MDNNKSWLSIIIAAYNAKQYIEDAVKSILKQSCVPGEIIIVDDGSTDGTGKVCDELAQTPNICPIRVIHQANAGHTKSRRKGIELAQGHYVLIMDSDDLLVDGILEHLHEIYVKDNPDVICFNYASFKDINHPKIESPRFDEGLYSDSGKKELLFSKMIYSGEFYRFGIAPNMWNKLFRRDLALESIAQVPTTIKHGEDGLMSYRALLNSDSIYVTNEVGYLYRSSANSISYRANLNRSTENLSLFAEYMNLVKEHDCPAYGLETQLHYYIVYQCLNAMEAEWQHLKNAHDFKGMLRQMRTFKKVFSDETVRAALKGVSVKNVNGKKNKLIVILNRN